MSKLTKAQQAERDLAILTLREMFPPNTTVTVLLRHVSQSGMSRAISVLHNERDVSWLVARATGFKFNQRWGGLTVTGCGMDIGFHLVYSLSRALYGEPGAYVCNGDRGYDPVTYQSNGNTRCASNDHSNGAPYVAGAVHSDGGYALSSRWL